MGWEDIRTTGIVIMAALGFLAAVIGAINGVLGLTKPAREERANIKRLLATDKARLDAHEKAIAELREGQKVVCGGLHALLEHELHNGNADQMQTASSDLTKWLLDK